MNYNPAANTDDGSCVSCDSLYVAPFTETFDDASYIVGGSVGPWGPFNNGWSPFSTNGANWNWTLWNGATSSFNTGPSADVSGTGNYMYTETSGAGSNKNAELRSYCIDASAVTNPALGFYYHMFGATQGTLQVNINGDSAWSMTGDQGDQWYQAQVDLSAYAGGNIFVQFFGFTGTSFTSDMAIDEVSVSSGLVAGCTDPIAINYDSTAVIDDGSCLYVMGCTNPAYANYDPLATMDDGSCAGCTGNSVAIEMFDSFGDGWNGNTYTITDSTGAVMATGGLNGAFGTPGGAYGVDSLCLPNGCYTITVGGGSWQSEVSFNFGSLLGAGVGTYTNVCFPVTGCTDTAATNYSPAATVDAVSYTHLTLPTTTIV